MQTSSIASHFVGAAGGLNMSMIAFSIVFLVIMGLMLVMMCIKIFAGAIDGSGKKTAAAPAAPTATPAQPQQPAAAASDDDEVVAVISAAVAAMCGSGARVRNIAPAAANRASSSGSAWRMTARLQSMEGFDC